MNTLTQALLDLSNRIASTPALARRKLDDPMFVARVLEAGCEVAVIDDQDERSGVIKSHIEQLLHEFSS